MNFAVLSNWTILASTVFLTIATFTAAAILIADGPLLKARPISRLFIYFATGLLTVGLVSRGIAAGRAPWGNMYEYAIAGALSVLVVYILILRFNDLSSLSVFALMPVVLALGLAQTVLYVDAGPLVPALKSGWLVIHVSAAIIAGGGFTVGFTLTSTQLAVGWKPESKFAKKMPSVEKLDVLAYRVSAWAFAVWTFAVLAGALWAESAWGRFWGWDPKETWALITWIFYAAYLHARVTVGWRGGKAAILSSIGYVSYIFNFFGVNIFFVGLHSYGGL